MLENEDYLKEGEGWLPFTPEYFTSKKTGYEYARWVGMCLVNGVETEIIAETRGKGSSKIIKLWFNSTDDDLSTEYETKENPFDVAPR